MFKVIADRLRRGIIPDINTLSREIAASYHWNRTLPLQVLPVEKIGDWKQWMRPCLVGMHHHTEPHVFKLQKNMEGETRFWYRKTLTSAGWLPTGPAGSPIIKDLPQLIVPWTSSVVMKNAATVPVPQPHGHESRAVASCVCFWCI